MGVLRRVRVVDGSVVFGVEWVRVDEPPRCVQREPGGMVSFVLRLSDGSRVLHVASESDYKDLNWALSKKGDIWYSKEDREIVIR